MAKFYDIMVRDGDKMEKITLKKEYLTLGQLLKIFGYVSTGGETKIFLADENNKIMVNNELENRRGRKLYAHDVVSVNGKLYEIV